MGQQYSSLKVLHHREHLAALRHGEILPPIYVRLKPTNRCNHHCSYCSYGAGSQDYLTANRDQVNRGDMLPWPKLNEIINDFGEMGVKALTFTGGGEPLSYPNILDAIRLTKKVGIDLALITNGSLLSGDIAKELYGAKWVRISFDAPNAQIYAASRGVKESEFDRVCENIKAFSQDKQSGCVLGVNYIINHKNAAYVYDSIKLLYGLGVENVKLSGVLANEKGYHDNIRDSVCAQIDRAKQDFASDKFCLISDYQRNVEDRQFEALPFHRCYICQLMTSVCADSKVYSCFMRAYDSKAEIGDLTCQSFYDFWYRRATQEKLRAIDPARDCHNQCVYDARNQIICDYLDMDMDHVNFI